MDISNQSLAEYSMWDTRGVVPYVDQWTLMRSPFPVALILLSYLAFVLIIGPAFMKKRRPFQLNNILIAYNFLQVIYSCFLFAYCFRIVWNHGIFHPRCLLDFEDIKFILTSGGHYYFLGKISELLDTVFIVLRNKHEQVTFLHVYHHTILVLYCWVGLKYEPTPSALFLITMNSFVHIVMYTYYGLAAFPKLSQYLWWKKYITTMQMVQFSLALMQMLIDVKYSKCQSSHILLSTMIFNLILFLYMFSNFYAKNYLNNKTKATNELKDEELIKKSS